jgi:hypothetical protein
MEQQRAHDKDRIWAAWMRAANAGDDIAYRRLLEAPVVGRRKPESGSSLPDPPRIERQTFRLPAEVTGARKPRIGVQL